MTNIVKMICIFAALTTINATCFATTIPIDITLGEWKVEQLHNPLHRYVHSRTVTVKDTTCEQTRIGHVTPMGILKPPTHIFWDEQCTLPLNVISIAGRDVDKKLDTYYLENIAEQNIGSE